jgi:O-antigen ligase
MERFLIFFFWILPFQWALSPMDSIDLALCRVLALGLIITFAVKSLAEQKLELPQPAILFPFSVYAIIAFSSPLWAENISWAVRKALFLINFLPLFIVFSASVTNNKIKERLLSAFIWSSTAAAFIGILQFLSQCIIGIDRSFKIWTEQLLPFFLGQSFGNTVSSYPSLLVNVSGTTLMRASAFFPDPHMFSLFLGLAIPIAGAFAMTQKQHQFAYIIAFLLLSTADLLTFSRGGYLGLAIGAICLIIGLFKYRALSINRKHFLPALGILIMFFVILAFSPIGQRLASSISLNDGSNIERLRLWKETLTYIAERPFFGVGLGNYSLLAKPSADYREPIYAHDLYLDIASETGLLSLAGFVGFVIIAIYLSLKSWQRSSDPFRAAALLSLIIFSVHSMFELPLFSVQVLPAFLFITALASATSYQSRK